MRTPTEVRLGDLLVKEGLISVSQLDGALLEQAESESYVPLGKILVDGGLVTAKQLSLLLDRSEKRQRLGEVLLRNRSITPEALEQALAEQRSRHRPLGQVLIQMGLVTDEAMRQALGIQLNIPFLDLDRVDIDRSLARFVNRNYARRHLLVPVSFVESVLTVSMNDPTSHSVVDDLTRSTGHIVNVVTSSQDAIKRAFKRMFDESPETVADAPAAAPETVDVNEDADGLALKSKYVEDYVQDKRADAAVRQIMGMAIERRCSDIHLENLAGRLQVRFRIDGMLQELDLGTMQQVCDGSAREIVSRIKILGKLDIAERRRPQDGAFRARIERDGQAMNVDFRISILPGYYGESVVLRILDKSNAPKSVDELGFSPEITSKLHHLLKRPAGILLITGPTGSGKSTTLYAALMSLFRPEIRILTAEDPIEYVYEQFSQSEVNDRIGNTFARYLRAFLRHDPEVIMIGEIRDEETAEMAFRAAQTGHLLLSTLHTNDAISSVTRLRDMNIDPNLLASSLLGVLAQRLVRAVCQHCREEYEPHSDLINEFFPERPRGMRFYRGAGCERCNHSGYRGRMSVAELWVPSDEDIILISKKSPMDEIRASARGSTISMVQDAWVRLASGLTNLEELIRMLPYSSVYQFRQAVATGEVVPKNVGV
jgi:type IV pilus assembly protein PilB